MKKQLFQLLAIGLIFLIGCQKELSFETGNNPSKGSLQTDTNGDCAPKTVNGTYVATVPLVPTANTISVQVNVAATGTYTIFTDTVNGIFFRATGQFTTVGANTVTLRGNGTPFADGTFNFVVFYDTSFCDVQVDVLPAGSGGPATFTLEGAPGNCTPGTVAGSYATGVALNASNTVTINVNVTTIGTYNISTTFQGMTFMRAGAFLSTGVQPVVLQGSGTPSTPGPNVVPLTAGTSTCNFTVNVGSAGVGTLGGAGGACTPSTVNGTYTAGTALTASNTVSIQVNVTTAGAFNITTNTVDGFSFAFSGTLAVGTQTVTLNGTGTPGSSGNKTFTVTLGAGTCTFIVNVVGSGGPGVGNLGGAGGACTPSTVNGTYTAGTALTASNTVSVQVTVTTAGTFNLSTNTVDGFSFAFAGSLPTGVQTVNLIGSGTPGSSGNKTFTVTMGGQTCTFIVNVGGGGGAAVYTIDCGSALVNGFYEQGSQLNICNTVEIDVNVTTAGTYTITTSNSGMTFSRTGTFAGTGIQNIILQGSGTPTANGNINMSFPAPSSCSFPVTVDPTASVFHWNFTITNPGPSTVYRGQDDNSTLTPAPPGVLFQLDGSNSLGSDALTILLGDINGTINNGETYSSSTTTANSAAFFYQHECSLDPYEANPTISGVTMTFTVTNHNTAAQTITGTFTGTAKNGAGQIITIASGNFLGSY